eukprot:5423445-Pyramimonas_sp.AAC.1
MLGSAGSNPVSPRDPDKGAAPLSASEFEGRKPRFEWLCDAKSLLLKYEGSRAAPGAQILWPRAP